MVSDAENTTNRRRPGRLQQKPRVRSRSPAVTHSIYGNIHSRERIKSQDRENAELPKPPPPSRQLRGISQRRQPSYQRGDSARAQCVLGVPLGRPVCARRGWTTASTPLSVGTLQTPGGLFGSVSAVGYPGSCRICSGGSLVCIRGEEPNAFPHFIVRLSCSAEM